MSSTLERGHDFPNQQLRLPKSRCVGKDQSAYTKRPIFCSATELRLELCLTPVGIMVARMPRPEQKTSDGDLSSALAVNFDN
jgi:hypothetical protein